MAEEKDRIKELSDKLDSLLAKHNAVSNEIDSLRVEIIRLKVEQERASDTTLGDDIVDDNLEILDSGVENESTENIELENDESLQESHKSDVESKAVNEDIAKVEQDTDYFQSRAGRTIPQEKSAVAKKKFDIEKLIGENLINKIGILILVIGVAIGAKLSIDKGLISPLARIISGYAVGIILIGLGMKLKQKYLNFSAVLVSGAMAIFYFITFFAFNFYQLIGQEVAFGLMVIFTVFTVLAALNYNKQIIAHLGLVGAISVPFLLSDNSGNILFLLSYLTLINLGIAFISLKKNWKSLFYSAFVLTWMIFTIWLVADYEISEHFTLAFSFLTIFFILFYIIFIAYKFLNLKKYTIGDVIILLLNSLLFFSIGYWLMYEHKIGRELLGVFAIGNAIIHFIAAYVVNKRKLADRNLFYLIIGLVFICLTLAIPIQLDGYWVTIMWSAEAVVLFLIGRSRQVAFYEYLSFVLFVVAGLSLAQDWEAGYYSISLVNIDHLEMEKRFLGLFFNSLFLTSLAVIISLGIINWAHFNKSWKAVSKIDVQLMKLLDYVLPILLISAIFFAIRMELLHYFSQSYFASTNYSNSEPGSLNNYIYDDNIYHSSNLWLLNYTMLFFTLISAIVYQKIKQSQAIWGMMVVNILTILVFLILCLYQMSELRENYINQYQVEYYKLDNSFMWLRYLSIGCWALLIGSTYLLLKKVNKSYKVYAIAEILFYLAILWVSSSELIHWLDFTGKSETYGLALSIFWGIFSVIIIAFGIWKKKKHLRILGIVIFAITLVKLFFYDLSNLTAISKTIVMISLGALLLLTSFLYNKYTIEDEEQI